jgi:LmbE family N-acetylglucosaminyl deacetylase
MNPSVALVIAAHPDDEVLGCGGTILALRRRGYTVNVAFMTDGESSRRTNDLPLRREHRRRAALGVTFPTTRWTRYPSLRSLNK